MKNKIMITAFLLSYTSLYAVSSQEIDTIENQITHLDKVVNNHYRIIKANRIESIDMILGRYKNSKSELLKKWFYIVTQSYSNPLTKRFIGESNHTMKFYLEQMLLDSKNPMNQKDYTLVSKKIMSLNESNREASSLNHFYITTSGVNLRNLPIFYKLTKQMVLKKGIALKLFYILTYKTEKGEISRWGNFQVEKTGQRGWINLKNTRRVK